MTDTPNSVHYRAYLLAYDLEKEDLYDRTRTAFLTRAGVLTELALRGAVADEDGDAVLVKPDPTGDPVLDRLLAQIGNEKRSWKSWLRHDYKETLDAIEEQLVARKLLTVQEKKVLGLVSKTHVTATDPAVVKSLQARAVEVLHSSTPATEIGADDAALVALAAAGTVPSVVTRKESKGEYKDRIEELTDRVGEVAPGLDKVLRGIRLTMIAAQGGLGFSG
jgi:Golgi phosphoprotein 3 GPP34